MEEKKIMEFDIRHITKTVIKKLWLILPIALICAAILVCYTVFYVPDTYTATTQMYISNVVDDPNAVLYGITSSDFMAASGLVNAYQAILTNENSLTLILQETGLQSTYSTGALRSMISATVVNETPVLQINVVSQNPQHAQMIANATTKILNEYDLRGASAYAIYQASLPRDPDSKGTVVKGLIGFMVGALVSAVLAVLFDFKRDTVRSDDWLREMYGEKIPVLSVIPIVGGEKNGKRKKYGYYERYGYYSAKRSDSKNEKA